MEEISQTQMYTSGAYRAQVLEAVARRDEIEAVLARHRTKKVAPDDGASAQEAADLADSVANEDDEAAGTASADAIARFPYRPYCRECGRDTVTTTAYDDATTTLSYTCSSCAYEGTTDLSTDNDGKLVWKVDWPMRWAYEKVDFEPAGRDHMTPGSSYTVGTELVSSIFDWRAPARVIYAFVGFAGVQKMSSSAGGVPTATDALRILEAPMLRWLYVRRAPTQAFDIDFGPAVVRLYDEWDALGRKAADPAKADVATLAWHRAAADGRGRTARPDRAGALPDALVGGRRHRRLRRAHLADRRVLRLPARLRRRPRAAAVQGDAVDGRARARRGAHDGPRDAGRRAPGRAERGRGAVAADLPRPAPRATATSRPSRRSSTACPKVARGLGFDDAPTDQVKADQKDFFRLLYHLLVDADRGPRLPTLVLALGPARVRRLLGA